MLSAAEIENKLVQENKTLAGSERHRSYTKLSAAQARTEARSLGFKGVVAEVFETEARKGLVSGSQFENVTQQGLLDEIITPLTLGLIHGPGPSTTTQKLKPNDTVETINNQGLAEQAENAPNSLLNTLSSFINAYGIRALEVIGGAALILFGLMTIAKKGDMKMPSAVPVPV